MGGDTYSSTETERLTRTVTAYEVPNVELGHHDDERSFDAIIDRYALTKKDSALARACEARLLL